MLIKEINGSKIALSLKFDAQNPWKDAAEKFAIGNEVTGTVARMTCAAQIHKRTEIRHILYNAFHNISLVDTLKQLSLDTSQTVSLPEMNIPTNPVWI